MAAPEKTSRTALWLIGTVAFSSLACAVGEDGGGSSRPAGTLAQATDTAAWYADQMAETLGGRDSWDRTRYVSFRWIVERDGQVVADREHSWDRYDGRYRVAFEQGGAEHLRLFNLGTLREVPGLGPVPEGRAWIGGEELMGAAADSALRNGYSAFINDTYWALMPFKWDDPGVHLSYEGRRTLSDGKEYVVIHLRFDAGLGLTEDRYWGFLDPDTGRMAAWQYHLGRAEAPDDIIWWTDWTPVGDIEFAMTRVRDGAGRFIYFEDVAASDNVPTGRFEPPTP